MAQNGTGLPSPEEFKRRYEAAYMVIERRDSAYGAQRWIAEQVHRDVSTVTRWNNGTHPIDAAAVAILQQLEERAARLARERERRAAAV